MSPLGQLHLAFALVALAAGGWVLGRPKGTRAHRRIGWVYAGSMVALNGSALLIYHLTGRFGPFHVAALVSLATLLAGVLPVWGRRRSAGWLERHYFFMAYSYLGLLAAAVAETSTRLIARPGIPGDSRTAFWTAVALATTLVMAGGGWLVRRRAEPTMRPLRRPPAAVAAAPAA